MKTLSPGLFATRLATLQVLPALEKLQLALLASTILLSAIIMCAWIVPGVSSALPDGWALMQVSTAIAILLLSIGLLYNLGGHRHFNAVSLACWMTAVLVTTVEFINSGQATAGVFDAYLVLEELQPLVKVMSLQSMICIALLATIQLIDPRQQGMPGRLFDIIVAALATLLFMYIAGYIHNAFVLIEQSHGIIISPHTLVCILLLTFVQGSRRAHTGLFSIMADDRIGSQFARMLLLPTVVGIYTAIFTGKSLLAAGTLDLSTTAAVVSATLAALMSSVIILLAHNLNRQSDHFEHLLLQHNDDLIKANDNVIERSKELDSLQKRMEGILKNILDVVVVINPAGIIQFCNNATASVLGYQPEELVGQNVKVLMPEAIRSAHDGFLHHHMKTGESKIIGVGREVTAIHKDGCEVPVHLAISRVELEGEVLFAGVLHDLSESKHFENILTQQNRELSAANEELEQFAYVASHDLKTPLRAIDNLIDWIMDDMQGICIPSEVQHNLGRLRERSQYMEKMIKELLAFSRAGRYAYPGEPVNVKQLVEQIVFELAPPAGMHIRIEDSLPVLNTPKPPLELVLRNLISNAVKYHDMPEGNISISLQSGDDVYTFSVTDDGPGIEPQYHAKVFQIFQTLQPKSQSNSTGMGLALVKRVVEGYGCSIRLMQNTNSRGSTFEFGWPAHWQEEPYNTEADNSSSSDEQDAA